MDRIVRSIFDVGDLEDDYNELRNALSPKERASALTVGQLIDELDRSSENSQKAAELLANAQVIHANYCSLVEVIESGLRDRAQRELIALKTKGDYNGRSSAEDVQSMMAKLAPDEYQDVETRKAEAKRTVEVLAALANNWVERQRNLRAIVARARGE